jgi:hypothetical protein
MAITTQRTIQLLGKAYSGDAAKIAVSWTGQEIFNGAVPSQRSLLSDNDVDIIYKHKFDLDFHGQIAVEIKMNSGTYLKHRNYEISHVKILSPAWNDERIKDHVSLKSAESYRKFRQWEFENGPMWICSGEDLALGVDITDVYINGLQQDAKLHGWIVPFNSVISYTLHITPVVLSQPTPEVDVDKYQDYYTFAANLQRIKKV